PAPSDDSAAEPEPEEKPKVKPKSVKVTLAANAFNFLYVRVGRKQLVIEPTGTVRLPPGTHKVFGRTSLNAQWIYFGKLEISAGDPEQRVLFVKPNKIEVGAKR
ncbi:MAG TPA: hypothetical protein VK034_10760, partial [Enhygromyxa sp.]|nr:hypothetical protein [Enhygromyxa sp.]